jgi:hypothetical protein
MANLNNPFGMRPLGNLSATGAQKQFSYLIKEDYDTSIFQGDLVRIVGGYVERLSADNQAETAVGVFNGCFFNDPVTGKPTFSNKFITNAAFTVDIQAEVIDDPSQLFLIQANSQVIVQADIGENVNVAYGTGNTTTGQSAMTTTGAPGTTQGNTLKIVGLFSEPGNELGAFAKLVVKINNHSYGSLGVTGVAS